MSWFDSQRDRRPEAGAVRVSRRERSDVLLIGLLAGCAEPETDPIMDRLQAPIADPRGAKAVAEMLQTYGGVPAWRRLRNVEYFYHLRIYGGSGTPQFSTRQLHRLGLGHEVQIYVEDLDAVPQQIVRFDAGEVAVTRGWRAGQRSGSPPVPAGVQPDHPLVLSHPLDAARPALATRGARRTHPEQQQPGSDRAVRCRSPAVHRADSRVARSTTGTTSTSASAAV